MHIALKDMLGTSTWQRFYIDHLSMAILASCYRNRMVAIFNNQSRKYHNFVSGATAQLHSYTRWIIHHGVDSYNMLLRIAHKMGHDCLVKELLYNPTQVVKQRAIVTK